MTLEEMKEELKKIESMKIDGRTKIGKMVSERKERLKMAIWEKENPESFENHRQALEGFVKSGCYGSL